MRWITYAEHILLCVQKIRKIQARGAIEDDEILYDAAIRNLRGLVSGLSIPHSCDMFSCR